MPMPNRVIPGRVYSEKELSRFRNGYFQCNGKTCGAPTTHKSGFCNVCRTKKCASRDCNNLAPNHVHCGACMAKIRDRRE